MFVFGTVQTGVRDAQLVMRKGVGTYKLPIAGICKSMMWTVTANVYLMLLMCDTSSRCKKRSHAFIQYVC
jgi:hypothetical protein